MCRCRFSGHGAHPDEQSSQDLAQDLQSPWADEPIHELSLPHWEGLSWKRADCPQPEEVVAHK